MRVRLADVAKRAGYSASTVCRALKSDPQIPESTRRRVAEVAMHMGYTPDPLLSAFASRRRGRSEKTDITTIAYLTKFPEPLLWRKNPFYLRLFEGAQARASQRGYKLQHCWMGEPDMSGERLSDILYHQGISAVCIAPTPKANSHLSLIWSRFSCIMYGYSLVRPALNRICPNNFHGILIAIRELRRLGYKRIGFCVFKDTSRRVDNQWLAGFLFCKSSLKGIYLSYFVFDDHSEDRISDWCRKERLEAVVGGEPNVLTELKRSGLYPGEIDYAAVSWTPEEPEIAGLDQRPEEIGATGVDLVTAQLQRGDRGLPAMPLTTTVEGIWKNGPSLRRATDG